MPDGQPGWVAITFEAGGAREARWIRESEVEAHKHSVPLGD